MAIRSFEPNSTNIEAVSYDDTTQILTVTFQGGDQYDYSSVSPSTFNAFKAAGSAGQFFHRQIKGRYSYDGPK